MLKNTSYRKRRLKKLALLITGLLLVTAFAEVILRVFLPQTTYQSLVFAYDFPCYQKGDFYPLALKKNSDCILHSNNSSFHDVVITTNQYGFRNREIQIPKPAGTYRILVIGDSYAAGWGVEEYEAYPKVLEKILRERYPDKNIEVINSGLPTAGPSYYYLMYKNLGRLFKPDLVIVGFYLVNDISDNVYTSEWIKTDADGLPLEVAHQSVPMDFTGNYVPIGTPIQYRIPVLRNLHFFILITNALDNIRSPMLSKTLEPRLCFYKKSCHDLDEAKEKAKKLLLGLKKLILADGAEMMIAVTPAEFHFDPKSRIKYGILVRLLPEDKEYPYQEFSQFFRENKFDWLDLRQAFTQASGSFYFETDNHWNELGHQVAARAIAEKSAQFLDEK
ncbi:MAG: hypothetical protein UV09_C0027G0003 [Candidatus Gottesmanbacteria bacterium GW2011_GWA2_42_18]|nr:MAG: hypothetical protein UV09_C0027G0003 [Candidatus Gottesmanbacteria bacterium GW2011_GWA2_42_18]OGG33481.1 MAG: hypothetical protein A3G68_03870 [Candidatus Gottesmanbacteria bacterium RIFCSPLOWO2_12_FULL_42_10]